MRIHIQNAPDDSLFAITARQWDEACRRAAGAGAGHDITIGETVAEFAAAISSADALITPPGAIAAGLPAAAPHLRLIFCTTAGVDALAPFTQFPTNATLVCNRGIHGEKAGEYAMMAVLMLATRMPALLASQRQQRWEPRYTPTLAGRRLTVVGLGTLGGAAAAHARHFGLHVTGVSRRGLPHSGCQVVVTLAKLDDVLAETEILLLACPLTSATRGLIDRRRLTLLRIGAGVVNIGRGAVLDEDALCDLLDADCLGGAILDVFEREPVPSNHRLWRTRNLIMTPHISADDPTSYNARTLEGFFASLNALRQGLPIPNAVDLAHGY